MPVVLLASYVYYQYLKRQIQHHDHDHDVALELFGDDVNDDIKDAIVYGDANHVK